MFLIARREPRGADTGRRIIVRPRRERRGSIGTSQILISMLYYSLAVQYSTVRPCTRPLHVSVNRMRPALLGLVNPRGHRATLREGMHSEGWVGALNKAAVSRGQKCVRQPLNRAMKLEQSVETTECRLIDMYDVRPWRWKERGRQRCRS